LDNSLPFRESLIDAYADSCIRDARILVTGGRGFIGSSLCHRLAAEGATVTSVGRTPARPGKSIVRQLCCDIADWKQCERIVKLVGPDLIFHLASHVAGARTPEVIFPTYHSNLTSTVNLLTAASQSRCRRVVITGSFEEPAPAGELDIPSSPYAAAKLAAGFYGRMFNALFDLPVVNLRVFMVYGPGQRDLKKLVPYVITSLARGQSPQLSSGSREIDWIFVEDVVEACLRAGHAEGINGHTIDVGSGEMRTTRQLVELIFELMGATIAPEFGSVADRPMEQVRCANVESTASLLGWRPRIDLRDGLLETIQWYRNLLTSNTDR
jgi:nucleoside-diphosphate-sugar epimerase